MVLEETIRNTPPQDRLGWAEMKRSEILENQKTKPPQERIGYIKKEPTGSRQTHPRAAKKIPAPKLVRNQIGGFIFHTGKDYSTDSEDDHNGPSGDKE